MFSNFIRISVRNFRKNKSNTLINITGLSLGITCSLIIFLIITFETSFNEFNKDYKNIYRLLTSRYEYGQSHHTSGVPYPMPIALKNDFGHQIERITFVDANMYKLLVTVKNDDGRISKFQDDFNAVFVEPDFFEIFTYQWLSGNKNNALSRPGTGVISETLAKKYFGSINAVGKIITINNAQDIEITGVIKDPPINSDIPFNIFIEIEGSKRITSDWGSVSSAVQCFIKLKNDTSEKEFEKSLVSFINKYRPKKSDKEIILHLQPLAQMHLDDTYDNFEEAAVTRETLLALGCIGIFLLLMACINYINLNTAVAINRAKEVGIRKVLGGKRSQVILNFFTETSLLVLFSIVLSLVLTEVLLDQLEGILSYKLSLSAFDPLLLAGFLSGLFVFVSLSAGVYPSVYLSGFKSLEAVRSRINTSDKNSLLRKSLVVTQFVIAHVIIIGTLVVINQIDYFRSTDMGFNKESIVEVSLPDNKNESLEKFGNELEKIPGVKNFSFTSTGAASGNLWTGNFAISINDKLIEDRTEVKLGDKNYLDTYGITLLAGEGLSESDTVTRFLVNESFVKTIGLGKDYSSVIGSYIDIWGSKVPVAGVVKDFNSLTLHQKINPLIIASDNSNYYQAGIKINVADIKSTISKIEKAWSTAYPDFVFEHSFLDQKIEEFYDREIRTSNILNTFSFIAILISCMGLFGLASHSISNKTKEIGIRKVLGATVAGILSLITKDFIKLIITGFIISVPLAYYLMNIWLEEFAYRITIGPGVFIIAVLFTMVIALITVGYKSVKAATANPVKSLKYE
ncbi:MAG: ABC transporter permease [Ignavibacteriaceae bacterium]